MISKCKYRYIFDREKKKNQEKVEKPIQLEIYWAKRIITFIDTHIYVKPNQWDKVRREVVKHSQANELNLFLKDFKDSFENLELDCINKEIPFTKLFVMEYIKQKKEEAELGNKREESEIQTDEPQAEKETYFFDDFVNDKIANFYKLKRIGFRTKQRHEACINSLLKFHKEKFKKDKISFTCLNKKYIEKVEIYFQDKYEDNTLNKFIQTFRKYVGLALKEKHITEDPFDGYTYRSERTKERTHLTEFEIEKIENIDKSKLEGHLLHVANRYLLSCYCGLRISDIQELSKKHIHESQKGLTIDLITEKGKGARVILPLYALFNGKGEKIVKYYLENHTDQETIFPKLSDKEVNDKIKEIAKLAEINKYLTFHSSRHTCATLLAEKTQNPFVIMKILGHSDIKTSMIYIHNSVAAVEKQLCSTSW